MSLLEVSAATIRGVHVAALLSLFGTLTFLLLVAPAAMAEAAADAPALRRRLQQLAKGSAACALIAGLACLMLQSALIADADTVAASWCALPTVLWRTQFGQWLGKREILLLAVCFTAVRSRLMVIATTAMAGVALAIQPMLGHAGAVADLGPTLITSEVLHLFAAGAWLGGLLPLFITVGTLTPRAAATACFGFTPVGLSALLVLGGTATLQVAALAGGFLGLLGTGYGHIALVKLVLFIGLLVLAALNRLALTEPLLGPAAIAGRRHMRHSILAEAIIGALVVIAAAFLASHAPGGHEQPMWPFGWRPSLVNLHEPELRNELGIALVVDGSALILAVLGIAWRTVRWPALAISLGALALATPHLDLLLVEAYPTSFFTSPTGFAAGGITRGAELFAVHCTGCHGTEGRGDGPAAKALSVPPADLTAEHFWAHADGELFWFVSHGFETSDGSISMPGFAGLLSDDDRWAVIDFLKAHNVGMAMQRTGKWTHHLPMPRFAMICADRGSTDSDDLRGHILRIVTQAGDTGVPTDPPPAAAMTTIALARKGLSLPGGATCTANGEEVWAAFAVLAGVQNHALSGEEFLIDKQGWLRAAWQAGRFDPRELSGLIADIAVTPVADDTAASRVHHH